jgi:hypothetical protein
MYEYLQQKTLDELRELVLQQKKTPKHSRDERLLAAAVVEFRKKLLATYPEPLPVATSNCQLYIL